MFISLVDNFISRQPAELQMQLSYTRTPLNCVWFFNFLLVGLWNVSKESWVEQWWIEVADLATNSDAQFFES